MFKLLLLMMTAVVLQAGSVRVAVAANVSYAIDTLVQVFGQKHPDIQVQVILGGTGKLTAQIRHGAPYQMLMAADMAYPEALYVEGLTVDKPKIYARGSLALLSTQKQDFSRGLALLKDPKITKIAIANPKTAPYGKAAFEALRHEGLLEALQPKFVFGESISQTVTHTVTAADIGLVAKSALYSPQMTAYREGAQWAEIPQESYTPIDQGVVILRSAKSNPEVKAFYDFLLSPEAGRILVRYGYRLP